MVAGHLLALCALPALAAAFVLRRARRLLAAGADPAAVWFGSAQWLVHVPAAVTLGVLASVDSPAELALRGWLEGLAGPFAPLLAFPFAMLPIACAVAVSTAALHDVTARTRGSDLTLAESLRQSSYLLLMMGALVAAVLGLMTASRLRMTAVGFAWVAACVAAALAARGRWARSLGLEPHAVTHGPLRDRLFALAAKAGVPLQQLYVVPMRRSRMANAFAVNSGVVWLTDWLIENLDRREIDAVFAHELAHIRLGHPRKLGLAAAAGVLVGVLTVVAGSFALAVTLGTLLSLLLTRFVSRRLEFAADALAVRMTGDPEALVTGLVRLSRLNHVPLQWSRAAESGLTHPSNRRRAEAIARLANLSSERLAGLLARDEPPRERDAVPAPARPDGKRFSSVFKRGASGRLSWLLLFTAAGGALVAVAIVRLAGLPRPLAFAAGTLAAFASVLLVSDLLAARGLAGLRGALAARPGVPAGAQFVGLSPGPGARVYEGFFDWDLGFLEIAPDALVYRGEEASFRLPRESVADVRRAPGPPGWIPAPRVAIEWIDPATGAHEIAQLRPAHAPRLDTLPRDVDALLARLRAWQAAPAVAAVRGVETPPREEDVTGTPLARVANPATLVPSAFVAGFVTLVLASLIRLPAWPFGGPGALDAWAAVVASLVLVRVPWWRAREPRRESAERERRAA